MSGPFDDLTNLCLTCKHSHIFKTPWSEKQPELLQTHAECRRWPGSEPTQIEEVPVVECNRHEEDSNA